MKKVFAFILLCITCIGLIGCNVQELSQKPNEKVFGDRSDKMKKIPISNEEYNLFLIQKVSPLCQNTYNLNNQAIAIKNGRIDRADEVQVIDSMLKNVESVREELSNLNVSEEKKSSQKNILDALDTFSMELTDYQGLLKNDSITKDSLQQKIDAVINALEQVKHFM